MLLARNTVLFKTRNVSYTNLLNYMCYVCLQMCFNTIFVIPPSWISNDLTLFMIKAKHRLLGNFHPVSSEWFYSLLTIVVRS